MKKLNDNSAVPLYRQVYNSILEEIKRENYEFGDQIPSETELCESFGVSRITIRKAIIELEEDGYLIKKMGKGTFVSYPKIVEPTGTGGSFTKSCELLGAIPTTEIVSISKTVTRNKEKKYLEEIFNNSYIKLERLRLVNGSPAIYEIDYFYDTYDFIFKEQLENKPIMEVINRNTALIADEFEDIIEVSYANEFISKKLLVNLDTPLLKITQKVVTENEEIIYVNEQYIKSELYKYVVRWKG